MAWEDAPDYGSRMTPLRIAVGAVVVISLGAAIIWAAVNARADAQPAPSQLVGVASVTDGDTIEIHGTRVRLSGFDSPERGSVCGQVNVYQRASLALSDFIGTRTVTCAVTGEDRYGRSIGTCSVGGVDLGERQVSQGWARDWPRYSGGAYADEEATARSARRGIWGLTCPGDLWGSRDYSR